MISVNFIIDKRLLSIAFPIIFSAPLSQITIIFKMSPILYSILGNKNACDVCARLNSLEAKVGTLDEHVTQEIKRLDNRITEEGDRATRELMKLIVKLTDNNRRVNSLFSTLFAHFTKEVEKLDKHVKEEVEKINARITEEVKRT